jgi:cyd operon protein YbgT
MWYFSWVLGLGFAVMFAVLNAMWLEHRLDEAERTAARDKR